jgi:hypothetical protein
VTPGGLLSPRAASVRDVGGEIVGGCVAGALGRLLGFGVDETVAAGTAQKDDTSELR